jgi:hypothetical protein
MSMTFTKLFSSITESSVWVMDDHSRIVWITMLAMADKHGRVWASIPGLANRARVPVESAEKAINAFLSADEWSRTKTDEGKRIEPIDGGWRLLNYRKYRDIRDDENRRIQNAEAQARFRSKQVSQSKPEVSSGKPTGKPIAEAEAEAEADHKESTIVRDANATVIYEFYPRKVGKPAAIKAIKRALMKFSYELVLEKTKAYAAARAGEDQQFTPHPATWFNQQRFNDDSSTWKISHATNQTNRNAGIIGHNPSGISKAERVLAQRAQIAKESAELALANKVAGNGINPSVSAGTSQQGTILL